MQRIIIIPARLQSTRLPRKPLLTIQGKPLIQWTYEIAKRCNPTYVAVASPDEEILQAVEGFGGNAILTHAAHQTGTHRVSQVVWDLWDGDYQSQVMNLQADEPLLDPNELNRLFTISHEADWAISTIVAPIPEGEEGNRLRLDRNLTKAAYGGHRCYWFSRANMAGSRGHLGVYLFRAKTLLDIAALDPTTLSRAESLEQLAWIEAGFRIHAIETETLPISINTQEDLQKFKRLTKCG